MRRVSAKFVPHLSTEAQQFQRLATSSDLFQSESEDLEFMKLIITGDTILGQKAAVVTMENPDLLGQRKHGRYGIPVSGTVVTHIEAHVAWGHRIIDTVLATPLVLLVFTKSWQTPMHKYDNRVGSKIRQTGTSVRGGKFWTEWNPIQFHLD
ncbi:hypothetical protein TNCV_2245611 [Trichonephila clavipes]|nr:hypothetical protein TNCV_2245611 [Trichonephila clavipes]